MREPLLKRILCVEDDPDIQMILNLALTEMGGYEVTFYGTAAAALANLIEDRPDLVLMDLKLPDSDGPELFKEIQRRTAPAPVPIVCITASGSAQTERRLSGLDIAGLITKPFDPMTLADQCAAFFKSFAARQKPTYDGKE